MIPALLSLCIAGWLAGFLLMRRVPTLSAEEKAQHSPPPVSVIIPARNEEANLPALLTSLQKVGPHPSQILVVDDDSSDATAAIARAHGVEVLQTAPLPGGWTGKTWACHQGAMVAKTDLLLFLDADTHFAAGGYVRMLTQFAKLPENAAFSVLPFHTTERPYEELSLFFNLLTAMGAGGFAGLDRPRLFGPCLLIRRDLYLRAGGHQAVRSQVLENLHFSDRIYATGGSCFTAGGRGVLLTRMFPHGFAQLREGWGKAFTTGAKATSPAVLIISVFWLGAACLTALFALLSMYTGPVVSLTLYLAFVLQIFLLARQVGTFRFVTALLYPAPLFFYFFTFARSALSRRTARPLFWRGRQV